MTFSLKFYLPIPRAWKRWYWRRIEHYNLMCAEAECINEAQARHNQRVFHVRAALASSKAREN